MAAAGGAGAAPNAERQYELYVKKFADVISSHGISSSLDKGIAEIFRYMNGIGPSRFSPLKKIDDPALKARILNTQIRAFPLLLDVAHRLGNTPALADIITLFHEHGADMNIADTNNANIVTHICIYRNAPALAKLLEIKREGAHIDINVIDTSKGFNATPLYHAAVNEAPALVEQLMAQPDIEPNGFVGPRNTTVLYEATYLGYHDTVRVMLASPRVDLLRGAPDGTTAFHAAARYGRRAVIEEFLRLPADRGFDPNHTNIYDETALYLARKRKHTTIVALLEPLVPAPPPLPHAPQTYRYSPAAPPQYYDAIMIGDIPVADADADTIVFNIEGSPGFFGLPKEMIQKHINKDKWVMFECLREQHGSATITVQMVDGIPRMAPVQTDFNPGVKYYNLKNGPFKGLVPLDEIRAALAMDTNTFQLRRSARHLAFTTDYKNVIVNGPRALGFKRKEVDNMSANHCQAGTAEDVWNIYPMVLEADPAMPAPAANAAPGSQGGGRRRRPRRLTRRRIHRHRRSRRHQKN
jgi:ankyrin repeat protein